MTRMTNGEKVLTTIAALITAALVTSQILVILYIAGAL